MSFPRDEVQTINYLARLAHANEIAKGFVPACAQCAGGGTVYEDTKAPPAPGNFRNAPLVTCVACAGYGSPLGDEGDLYKRLCHISGELNEIFELTRLYPLEELVRYTGRPGVVPVPGYTVVDPCVPAVPDAKLPGHPAIAVEAADVLIRVLALGRACRLDVGQALEDKMIFNRDRPHRHGKRH